MPLDAQHFVRAGSSALGNGGGKGGAPRLIHGVEPLDGLLVRDTSKVRKPSKPGLLCTGV